MTEQDGWIEWHGGECPVATETLVLVQLRDDSSQKSIERNERPSPASGWVWSVPCSEGVGSTWDDIIAYRVVKP